MANALAPAGKQQLLPFRSGTRKRHIAIGQFPVTLGQPLPTITLPQVGMLAGIYLKLEGTITLSAAGVQSALGYASLFNRIRVNANLGSASLVDVSGIGAEILNQFIAPGSTPVKNTFGNAAAANLVEYGVYIPINLNDRDQFQFGLIDLQAPEVRVTLDVIFNGASAFTTNETAASLQLFVAYDYWQIPDPTRYALPPRTLVRSLEDAPLLITATGDQIYTIPRLGTLAQMAHLVLINGAPATLQAASATVGPQVSEMRLRINKTDTVLDYFTRFKEIEEALLYNTPSQTFLRQGVMTWDFFHSSMQRVNGGGGRDMYDTEAVTTLESILTIDPNVAIAGTCQIQPIRRVLQRLV